MKKLVSLLIIGIFLFSIINIDYSSATSNDEVIIMKIFGGIGYGFSVENKKDYCINGSFNLTDSNGNIFETNNFKVYPNNIFGVRTWIVISFPFQIFSKVTANLTVENQTLIKQGFKMSIFWLFR